MKKILLITLMAFSFAALAKDLTGTYSITHDANHIFEVMKVDKVEITETNDKLVLSFGEKRGYGVYTADVVKNGDKYTFEKVTGQYCDGCGCFGISTIKGEIYTVGPEIHIKLEVEAFDEDIRFIGWETNNFVK